MVRKRTFEYKSKKWELYGAFNEMNPSNPKHEAEPVIMPDLSWASHSLVIRF